MDLLMMRRRAMEATAAKPYDAEVAYLEGDGVAYIDTGLKACGDMTISTRLVEYFNESGKTAWAFGGRDGYENKVYGLYINGDDSEVKFDYGSTHYSLGNYSGFPDTCQVDIEEGKIRVGPYYGFYDQTAFTSSKNVYLFALNNGGTALPRQVKIGPTKISDGTTTLDLIPVRKKGIGYMYDKVSGKLYGNAAQSGAFGLGSDYIYFSDINVEALCTTTYGDGTGLKPKDAAKVSSVGTVFNANTALTSFDEFKYFSGVTSIANYGFRGSTGLTYITLPETVKTIGTCAFSGVPVVNLSLRNVTTIGTSAVTFSKIKAVDAPNLTSLGASSFNASTGLEHVVSLGSITAIPIYTFCWCSGLKDINWPSGLTAIGNHAVKNCFKLTTGNLPQTVTSIGEFAFYSGVSLEGVINLPNLTSIGNAAFRETKITEITSLGHIAVLPGATNASGGTFRNCYYLTAVTLPDTLTNIQARNFSSCTALTTMNWPSGLTTIGSNAFAWCYRLLAPPPQSVRTVAEAAFWCTTDMSGALNLPNLTSIENTAFNGSGIESITSLGNITTIPGHTNTISGGAFSHCARLSSATLPDTLRTIGPRTFYASPNLENVYMGSGVTTIQDYAFHGCSKLTTTVPSSVTSISAGAFSGCSNGSMGILNLPNLTSLADGAFRGASIVGITSLGSITSIPGASNSNTGGAFRYCSKLTSVTLPDTLVSIGIFAFANCTALTTVNWNSGLTTISTNAFSACTNLTGVLNFPSLTSIGDASFRGTHITEIVSLGTISSIPGGTNANSNGVFKSCTLLTAATLPSTLTSLGGQAFHSCSNLKTLVVLATTPPTFGTSALTGTNSALKIYVPYSYDSATDTHPVLNAYKAAAGWSGFAAKIYELDQNGNIPA